MGIFEMKKRMFSILANATYGVEKLAWLVKPPVILKNCMPGNLRYYEILGGRGETLFPYPFINKGTVTMNGITFTDNGDGTITANGTATAGAVFYLVSAESFTVEKGIYRLFGCPSKGSASTYYISLSALKFNDDGTYTTVRRIADTGDTSLGVIDLSALEYTGISASIEIKQGAVLENVTFKPSFIKEEYVGDVTTGDEPKGYKIPITVSGVNMFDENLLLSQGWVDYGDNSYYIESNSTVYKKRLWENSEGYTGQLKINYQMKFRKSNDDSPMGSRIRINYTDGTKEAVSLVSGRWQEGIFYDADYHTTSNAAKVIDYIDWEYGTNANSTWVRNIIISKYTDKYEPYKGSKTTNIYLSAPLKFVGEDTEVLQSTENGVFRLEGTWEDITAPDIELVSGTNVITVDTAIQPEFVTIGYYVQTEQE